MIPLFPNFSPYNAKFNEEVMLATAHMPRYTETSMASMFCWDKNKQLSISRLFGNIVLIINQEKPGIVTLLGTSKIDTSLDLLFSYCDKRGFARSLQLVSEPTVLAIKNNDAYIAIPDADHHDYVVDLPSLSTLEGSPMRNTRRKVKACTQSYQNLEYIRLDLNDTIVMSAIHKIFKDWMSRTIHRSNPLEYRAAKKLLEHHADYGLIARGITDNGSLIAFIVLEPKKPWLHGHFWKANLDYNGVYQFLMHKCALEFNRLGYMHMNIEEDLGIHGLRTYKQLFSPTLLRKYSVISVHAGRQQPVFEALPNLNLEFQQPVNPIQKA